jgi:hypothetical protein
MTYMERVMELCTSGYLPASAKLLIKVVARDGIEPPTPAFSGPRSTTELSGLGGSQGRLGSRWRVCVSSYCGSRLTKSDWIAARNCKHQKQPQLV